METMITTFKTSYIEVTYNRIEKIVEYKWIGFIKEDDAKVGLQKILETIRDKKAIHLLAEIKEFKGGTVETAKWVNEVWSEQLVMAGLKNVALTVPENIFGEFSNKVALGEKFVKSFKVEEFASAVQARAWLKSQN
jgi:hypothetical protein